MAGILGALGLRQNDKTFINTVGQQVVYTEAARFIERHNQDMQQAYDLFIQETTENFKERYKLPGGGRLQRLGTRSRAAATRVDGRWDVAYPLESFGSAFEYDRIAVANMTVQQFNNELLTIRIQDVNTVRYEILRALLDNTARTFVDPLEHVGTLTIQPLANGDAVLYPPVLALETEATEDHYLVSGYTTANISDTNNPFPTLRNELEEHFGTPTGFGNIVAFINTAEVAKVQDLTDFIDVTDIAVTPGNDTDTLNGLPNVPGRILGRVDGVWVVEWRYIPATYILAIDLDQPAPLKKRVPEAGTGLPAMLDIVAQDEKYPITTRNYEHLMGVGVGNRLNGVVMQLKASGTYDIPAAYA